MIPPLWVLQVVLGLGQLLVWLAGRGQVFFDSLPWPQKVIIVITFAAVLVARRQERQREAQES